MAIELLPTGTTAAAAESVSELKDRSSKRSAGNSRREKRGDENQ
jgi:hypothetical protein